MNDIIGRLGGQVLENVREFRRRVLASTDVEIISLLLTYPTSFFEDEGSSKPPRAKKAKAAPQREVQPTQGPISPKKPTRRSTMLARVQWVLNDRPPMRAREIATVLQENGLQPGGKNHVKYIRQIFYENRKMFRQAGPGLYSNL